MLMRTAGNWQTDVGTNAPCCLHLSVLNRENEQNQSFNAITKQNTYIM